MLNFCVWVVSPKGFVADIQGSYVPVFHMVGGVILAGAVMQLGVFCVKRSDKLDTKEEMTIFESLVVVEKCSVV